MNSRRILHMERDREGAVIISREHGLISLAFNDSAAQTACDPTDPGRLIFDYFPVMLLALVAAPRPSRVLCLGLGGGALPRFLLTAFSTVTVDAVEPRPLVTRLAHQFCMLPKSDRLTVHTMTGLEFLAQNHSHYDAILVDIFDAYGMANDLVRPPFYQWLLDALAPGGVVSMNVWNSDRKKFAAIKKMVHHSFGIAPRLPIKEHSNVVLFGSKSPWPSCVSMFKNALLLQRTARFEQAPRLLAGLCVKNPRFLIRNLLHRRTPAGHSTGERYNRINEDNNGNTQ